MEKTRQISELRKKQLLEFQVNARLDFNDISLLDNALTHSSYINESKDSLLTDNERLEFLGDSVLSVSVSDWLYRNLSVNEGECTKIKSVVVSEDSLCEVAHVLELSKYMLMGKGEELTGGRHKNAILADCTEAVFAAVYLDKGMEYAQKFILNLLEDKIKSVSVKSFRKDYKTALQEYVQKRYKIVPTYTLVNSSGPEHDPVFYYTVSFVDKCFGPESGHNKKDAEQNVAKLAWNQLNLDCYDN